MPDHLIGIEALNLFNVELLPYDFDVGQNAAKFIQFIAVCGGYFEVLMGGSARLQRVDDLWLGHVQGSGHRALIQT